MPSFGEAPHGAPVDRVLVVHNAYQHLGGEDAVVEAEMALLRDHGHRVELYSRDNGELAEAGPFTTARDMILPPGSAGNRKRGGYKKQARASSHQHTP